MSGEDTTNSDSYYFGNTAERQQRATTSNMVITNPIADDSGEQQAGQVGSDSLVTGEVATPPASSEVPLTQPSTSSSDSEASRVGKLYPAVYNLPGTGKYNGPKFCGTVPEDHAEVKKLTAYTVGQWLADTEIRITSKHIEDDRLKINEAILAVDQKDGDAHGMVTVGTLAKVDNWAEFKSKCRRLWQPEENRDRFLTINSFMNLSYRNSPATYCTDLSIATDRVIDDLRTERRFKVGDVDFWLQEHPRGTAKRTTELVALEDIIKYFSWGVSFNAFPPDYKEALRRIDLSVEDDQIDIFEKIGEEVRKYRRTSQLNFTASNSCNHQTQQRGASNSQRFPNNRNWQSKAADKPHKSNHPRSGGQHQSQRGSSHAQRGQYQGNNSRRYADGQADNRRAGGNQGEYRGFSPHQGQHPGGTRPKVQCQNCNKMGHEDRYCRTPRCEICGKLGHTSRTCWYGRAREEENPVHYSRGNAERDQSQ